MNVNAIEKLDELLLSPGGHLNFSNNNKDNLKRNTKLLKRSNGKDKKSIFKSSIGENITLIKINTQFDLNNNKLIKIPTNQIDVQTNGQLNNQINHHNNNNRRSHFSQFNNSSNKNTSESKLNELKLELELRNEKIKINGQ